MSRPRPRLRPRVWLVAKIVVAVAIMAWLLGSGRLDVGRLTGIPRSGDLVLLVAILAASMAVPVLRWWWLLRIQGLKESLGKVALLTWSGYFGALVLPGTAGGDLAKGYLVLHRRSQARARAFSTVLADRLLGLQSLLLLSVAAAACLFGRDAMTPAVQWMSGAATALFLALAAGGVLLLAGPSRSLLLGMLPAPWREAWDESFDLYKSHKPALAGCFLLSIASSLSTVAAFGVASRLLGEPIPWEATLLAGPLVIVANCLPLTPGGVGVAEAASSQWFGAFGVAVGAEVMVALRLILAVLSLPGAMAWAFAFDAASTTGHNAAPPHAATTPNRSTHPLPIDRDSRMPLSRSID